MNKKVRLAGALGALTTASIAITAFTLPQFNSLDSYLYRPTNWTEAFANRALAFEHIETLFNDGEFNALFNEEKTGTRTVNTYLIEGVLEGIQNDYFSALSPKSGEFTDEDNDPEAAYNEIKNRFLEEITSHLANALITNTTNKYIPSDQYSSSTVYSGTNLETSISEYFRGLDNSTYATSAQAFASLLDQSQIAFGYKGQNYDTVDQVIAAWMMDNGYDTDSAYKEVFNHIRWEAQGSYTDTNSNVHSFQALDENKNQDDKDTFIKYAETSFYNEMRKYEVHTEHQYSESEWLVTSDYENSRDSWLSNPSNNVIFDAPLHSSLQNESMGDAFGWYGDTNYAAEEFLPFRNKWGTSDSNHIFWQKESQEESNGLLPNMHGNIQYSSDFAYISLLGLYTKEHEVNGTNQMKTSLINTLDKFCSADGSSNKDSAEWESWEKFADFMGYSKLEISVNDRLYYTEGTQNEWWEPDCEGLYHDYGLPSNNESTYFEFVNHWFMNYFGYDIYTGSNAWRVDYWLGNGNTTTPMGLSFEDPFVFTKDSNNGAIEGKTMVQALMQGGSIMATEEDYKNSTSSSYLSDFRDWVNIQDVVWNWNGKDYRGRTEEEVMAQLESDIRIRIEAEWINLVINQVTETHYDIQDSYRSALVALDSSFKMTDYASIEQARNAVEELASINGSNNIYTEVGLVKFVDDAFYNFDTSEEYLSIDEARLSSNWDKVVASKWSAPSYSGLFEDMLEYSTNRVQVLEGFNDSAINIIYSNNANAFATMIRDGYDFSSIDSSINNIYADFTSFDKDDVKSSAEFVTYDISLKVDSYNEELTKWISTNEFEYGDPDQQIQAFEDARKELIQYWKDYIGA